MPAPCRGVTHQRVIRPVRGEQRPGGVVDRDRRVGQPVEKALDALGDAGRYDVRPGRYVSREFVEQHALGIGDAQPAGDGLDHLRRGRRRAALFEPSQVVRRDPREGSELLAPQSRRPATGARGHAHRGRRDPVTPATDRSTELPHLHNSSVQSAGPAGPGPGSPTQLRPRRRAVTAEVQHGVGDHRLRAGEAKATRPPEPRQPPSMTGALSQARCEVRGCLDVTRYMSGRLPRASHGVGCPSADPLTNARRLTMTRASRLLSDSTSWGDSPAVAASMACRR